jgi:hypothetical protein
MKTKGHKGAAKKQYPFGLAIFGVDSFCRIWFLKRRGERVDIRRQ